MMGPAAMVSGFTATLAHERIEVEDTAVAVIRFKSGALGVIQATTSVHPGYPKTIAIHGERGSAAIEQDDVLRWDFTPETDADLSIKARFSTKVSASGGSADPKAISHEGHRRQLADFVEAVRSNRPPKVDGKEGKKAVDLICAIYESNRTGKAVEVPK
jgi:predicted dehydrogenase